MPSQIIYSCKDIIEAQRLMPILEEEGIGILHVPNLNSAIMGVNHNLNIEVPEEQVEDAIAILLDMGIEKDKLSKGHKPITITEATDVKLYHRDSKRVSTAQRVVFYSAIGMVLLLIVVLIVASVL